VAPRLSQGTRTPDDPAPRFSFVLYAVADESQPSLTRSTSAVEGRNPQECKHLQPPALATRRTGRRTCIWQCGLTSGPLRHDWPLDAVARETRRRPGRDLLVSTGAGPGHAHPKRHVGRRGLLPRGTGIDGPMGRLWDRRARPLGRRRGGRSDATARAEGSAQRPAASAAARPGADGAGLVLGAQVGVDALRPWRPA